MRTKLSLIVLCGLIALASSPAHALVVGREGVTYPIKERDMLELIQERAEAMDTEEFREKLQADLKEQIENFRPHNAAAGIPIALSPSLHRVDLTYTVPQDVTDLHGQIIYPGGHKVNPLRVMADQGMTWPFMLVILNGEREEEIAWFETSRFNNERVKVLVSDGYPYKLAERLKRPVYQLTTLIQERFRIKATPSLVMWPLKSDYLAVRAIPVPETAAPDKSPKDAHTDDDAQIP